MRAGYAKCSTFSEYNHRDRLRDVYSSTTSIATSIKMQLEGSGVTRAIDECFLMDSDMLGTFSDNFIVASRGAAAGKMIHPSYALK